MELDASILYWWEDAYMQGRDKRLVSRDPDNWYNEQIQSPGFNKHRTPSQEAPWTGRFNPQVGQGMV